MKMIFLRVSLLILVTCSFLEQASSQVGLIQMDKPYYFAGDPILYNLHVANVKSDSIIIKVTLSKDTRPLSEHLNVLEMGQLSGYFKLSHELTTGTYKLHLHAYDKETGNPISLITVPISVFGDLSPSEKPHRFIIPERIPRSLYDGGLTILLPDETHVRRERIECILTSPEPINQVSICIRKQSNSQDLYNLHHFRHDLNLRECHTNVPVIGVRKLLAVEQTRNILLIGLATDSRQFQLASVDKEGRFTMEFPKIYGKQVVQFIDFLGLSMEVKNVAFGQEENTVTRMVTDSSIFRQHQLYQKRREIDRLFNRSGIVLEPLDVKVPHLSVEPEHDIDVQDYDIRGTMVDLFKEILTSLKFRKKGAQYRARVLFGSTANQHFHEVPPLFLINGMATQNQDFVANLPLQEVKRIRIFSERSTLRTLIGGRTTGGVIMIDLVDPFYRFPQEIAVPSLMMEGLQKPIKLPIQYDHTNDGPQINSLVYWSPSNKMDQSQRYPFQFVTPDLVGEYTIEVVAQNMDGQISITSKTLNIQ